MSMKFEKKSLTITEQIELLKSREMTFTDEENAKSKLSFIGYYRLSAYLKFFQKDDDQFKNGTDFENILNLYVFDRKLKIMLFDPIERIEISLRATMILVLSNKLGNHWYNDPSLFLDKLDFVSHQAFITKRIKKAKSKSVFLGHFYKKYHSETFPPAWMFLELLTFGEVLNIYSNLQRDYRQKIARSYCLDEKILTSWLKGIVDIRNICAHHGRLWNHHIKAPRAHEDMTFMNSNRLYDHIITIEYFLSILSPHSEWKEKFNLLLKDFDDIPTSRMGSPNEE